MNRRTLLKAAAAAGGAIALPSARAQPAPPSAAKGPPVWLDLDQKALDDAYDQSVWATNGKQLLDRYAVLSDDVRTHLGTPQRFSYGATIWTVPPVRNGWTRHVAMAMAMVGACDRTGESTLRHAMTRRARACSRPRSWARPWTASPRSPVTAGCSSSRSEPAGWPFRSASAGCESPGIELSTPMIDRLRAKVDEATIPVIAGDMATTVAPGEYSLVYLVFNTISNLLTQAEQVACFRNAARHLVPGGRFVIELWVPELRKLPPGQQATVWRCDPGYIGLDTYDVPQQHLVSYHFTFDESEHARLVCSPHRYIWPAEAPGSAAAGDRRRGLVVLNGGVQVAAKSAK